MNDITLCASPNCSLTKHCFRKTTEPNSLWQSYADFSHTCSAFRGTNYKKDILTWDCKSPLIYQVIICYEDNTSIGFVYDFSTIANNMLEELKTKNISILDYFSTGIFYSDTLKYNTLDMFIYDFIKPTPAFLEIHSLYLSKEPDISKTLKLVRVNRII